MIDVNVLLQQVTAELARPATRRTACSSAPRSFDAAGGSRRTSTARRQRRVPVAVLHAGRAARTATTSSTTTRSTRSSAGAEDVRRAWRPSSRRHGLGLILDVVPNHMGIDAATNPWWLDVLENGPSSPLRRLLRHRLAPAQARAARQGAAADAAATSTAGCSRSGEIGVALTRGRVLRAVPRHAPPVEPAHVPAILGASARRARRRLGAADAGLRELQKHPHRARAPAPAAPRRSRRARASGTARRRSSSAASPRSSSAVAGVRELIDEQPARSSTATPGEPAQLRRARRAARGPGVPPGLLARGRATRSTTAASSTSTTWPRSAWRSRDVFDARPRAPARLVGEGKVDRPAHRSPGRLYAPGGYFRQLQEGAVLATARRLVRHVGPAELERARARTIAPIAAADPAAPTARPLYVVAEKILCPASRCPTGGRCAGTTGYEFLARSTASSSTATSRLPSTALYERFAGAATSVMADDVRQQEADHAGVDGERGQPARPPARPDLRAQPPLPRLHPVDASCAAARGDRRFPVYRTYVATTARRRPRATARTSSGGRGRAAPEPDAWRTRPSSTSSSDVLLQQPGQLAEPRSGASGATW